MTANLVYGDHKISYIVTRNTRLVTKVRIHVHANGRVEVEAPLDRPDRDIREAVQKRARWISTRLAYHSAGRRNVVAREYKSGETHFYLGRRYQLKVIPAAGDPQARGQDRAYTERRQWAVDRSLWGLSRDIAGFDWENAAGGQKESRLRRLFGGG